MTVDERSAVAHKQLWILWIKYQRRPTDRGRQTAERVQSVGVATQDPTDHATALASRGVSAATSATGPSEHTTAGMRVSRSTGRRMPRAVPLRHRQQGRQASVQQLGQATAATRLEPGHGVVRDACRALGKAQPEVEVGPEAIGGSGLERAVRFVDRHDLGAGEPKRLGHGPAQLRRSVELADDDALVGQARAGVQERLLLAHGGDGRVAGAVGHAAQRLERLEAADPVGCSPLLRWKSASATAVSGPKMPSTRPASKPRRPSRAWSSATSSPRVIGVR